MADLTSVDLVRLLGLLTKCAPGRWHACGCGVCGFVWAASNPEEPVARCSAERGRPNSVELANAEFIAAIHEAAPELIRLAQLGLLHSESVP